MIKRNLWNCSKNVKTTAFTAIVRPKLEYAFAVWDPSASKRTLLRLRGSREKRHGFAPTTINHPTASVTEMLRDLGWTSLEVRRTMTRLNLLNKISRGEIDIDVNSYLQPQSEVRTRGSHRYIYRQDKTTKNHLFLLLKDHKTME